MACGVIAHNRSVYASPPVAEMLCEIAPKINWKILTKQFKYEIIKYVYEI
jgi:hypothetical protein